MKDYVMTRRVTYEDGATFIPVCENCKRFVKADAEIFVNGFDELKDQPNATCKHCGRIKMEFEGYF